MKKTILYVVVLLIAFAVLIFNNHFKRLKVYIKEARMLKKEKEKLEAENKKLKKEIEALRTNPEKYEEIARRQLGMVKRGEIKYSFIEKK